MSLPSQRVHGFLLVLLLAFVSASIYLDVHLYQRQKSRIRSVLDRLETGPGQRPALSSGHPPTSRDRAHGSATLRSIETIFPVEPTNEGRWVRSTPTGVQAIYNHSLRTPLARLDADYRNDPYLRLTELFTSSALFLPRYQFAIRDQRVAARRAPSGEPGRAAPPGPASDGAPANLSQTSRAELVAAYLAEYVENQYRQRIAPYEGMLEEPLGYESVGRREVSHQGVSYRIERFQWEALPGMVIPATAYLPATFEGELPLILSPAACGEGIHVHDEGTTSVQRRLANIALAGMIGVYTEGFCHNGMLRDIVDNKMNYGHLLVVTGDGPSANDLNLIVWHRLLRLAKQRWPVDPDRIGVTGYSQGSNIARGLSETSREVSAIVDVRGTSCRRPASRAAPDGDTAGRIPVFQFDRYATRLEYPEHHSFSVGRRSDSGPPLDHRHRKRLASHVTDDERRLLECFSIVPDRLQIVAKGDDMIDIDASRADARDYAVLADRLGLDPRMQVRFVAGEHAFNEERRTLMTRWFAARFGTKPLLEFRDGLEEHETPILSESELTQGFRLGSHTLYGFFTGLVIEQLDSAHPVIDDSDRLHAYFDIEDLMHDGADGRAPIRVETEVVAWNEFEVEFSYFLLPMRDGFTIGLAVASPSPDPDGIDLHVSTHAPIPDERVLVDAFRRSRGVALVILPGYGLAGSAQRNTGNLARHLFGGPTLLDFALSAVRTSLDFLATRFPGHRVSLRSEGIEAGIVTTLAAALFPDVAEAVVHEGITSWREYVAAPTKPLLAPIMVHRRLLRDSDIHHLQELAGAGRLEFIGEPVPRDWAILGPPERFEENLEPEH